ncbi:MAG TPA: efflux RND transporter permease subunit, partial [Pirellulales bacterium]
LLLRMLKWGASGVVRASMFFAWPIVIASVAAAIGAGWLLTTLDRDFLPPFNEGVVQVNALMPAGTSLAESQVVARQVERQILSVAGVQTLVRRTGRAELDEHAMSVNVTEMIVSFDPNSGRSREEILDDVRAKTKDVPGVVTASEQPLAHSISHMLSGVSAQIAIKLYGDDLETLRREASAMQRAIATVPGVVDLQLEQQTIIPQLRIEFDGAALKRYGLQRATVTDMVETAMNGRIVSSVLQGQRSFDLIVRMQDDVRLDRGKLERLAVPLPQGGSVALSSVARIYDAGGPNTVERDNARRRIVLQCNVSKRGLVDVVEDIKAKLKPLAAKLPTGYFLEFGGQFESQQSASLVLGGLFVFVLIGMCLILYTLFGSLALALQEMAAVPTAFVGAVLALVLTHQTFTVAAMVGFISLCGIAVRNGILLITHYQHLATHEGQPLDESLILRGSMERLAPVLMTALTSGIGLFPLTLAAGEPGKEVLYPVATVIVGGLLTSTLLEFVLRPALFRLFGLHA